VHVVGRQDDGRAGQAEEPEPLDQVELGAIIQGKRGLIQQQDGWAVHQRLDEVELSLHPQRVLGDQLVAGVPQAGPSEQLVEPVAGELIGESELVGEEPGILIARHLVEMRRLVEHDPEPPPH